MATTEKLALIDNSGVSTTDLLINTGTPTFEGKAEPQTSVELFDNDDSGGSTSLGTTTADSNGDWSFTVAAGSELADGGAKPEGSPHSSTRKSCARPYHPAGFA